MTRHVVFLRDGPDFEVWRSLARAALQREIPPEAIHWRVTGADPDLFSPASPALADCGLALPVTALPVAAIPSESVTGPEAFDDVPFRRDVRLRASCLKVLRDLMCHADSGRFALAYRLAWRVQEAPWLLEMTTDPDVNRARVMIGQLRKDSHRMVAYVRFRERSGADGGRRRFLAWFEPDHHILERVAPFFSRRFTDMDWMILTPRGSKAMDGHAVAFSSRPCARPDLSDDVQDLWNTYYASTFNPARVRTKAMRRSMPTRYWKNLPETRQISALVVDAEVRVRAMADQEQRPAPAFHERLRVRRERDAPRRLAEAEISDLAGLNAQIRACTACPLHCSATQAVVGEGAATARVVIVGEQPGDQEDLAGRPFVGPAGRVLDDALAQAGVDRGALYLTNAVKHFRFRPQGRRRIHQTPDAGHVEACAPWLLREIALLRPTMIVSLGATALRALDGPQAALADRRGKTWRSGEVTRLALAHPSWFLRMGQDDEAQARRAVEMRQFVEGLRALREVAPSRRA